MNKQVITVDVDPDTGQEWVTITDLDADGNLVAITVE